MHVRHPPPKRQPERGPAPTLWVVGTSVSIEEGGYATHLAGAVRAAGWTFRNLSVGDQTSVMGWMRLMQHAPQLERGDVVVWEYSLLDQLLPQGSFAAEDAFTARRLAWTELWRRGVGLVVAITPPAQGVDALHAVEREYLADAAALGVAVVDLRQVAATLGLQDLAARYRDDRHPDIGTPLLRGFADAILTAVRSAVAPLRPRWEGLPDWTWIGAEALAAGRQLAEFRNALVHVAALSLAPDDWVALPTGARVVAAGVASTHDGGGLWCGHAGCPPASTRLPADLHYRFLLRATGMACRRPAQERMASAPSWSFACGQWRDYGQANCTEAAPVAVFGVAAVLPPRPPWLVRAMRSVSAVRLLPRQR